VIDLDKEKAFIQVFLSDGLPVLFDQVLVEQVSFLQPEGGGARVEVAFTELVPAQVEHLVDNRLFFHHEADSHTVFEFALIGAEHSFEFSNRE
jgi:hypothetical protein